MKKSFIIITLFLSLMLSACSSNGTNNSSNLMAGIKQNNLEVINILELSDKQISTKEGILNFSLKLFNESFNGENILMSPVSIISALGMVTNGANGNTLSELEDTLGSDAQALNDYLKAYANYLPSSKKSKVSIANSIWFRDIESLTIDKNFLQTNKDYYDASIYKAPFDESTKDDINTWVNKNTDGMIESLLEEAPSDSAVMYLINALSFDAEWEKIYTESEVFDSKFK